jgi:hypothetical protein
VEGAATHAAEAGREPTREGHELEVFAVAGQTTAVVSVPASAVREATGHDVLFVREKRA